MVTRVFRIGTKDLGHAVSYNIKNLCNKCKVYLDNNDFAVSHRSCSTKWYCVNCAIRQGFITMDRAREAGYTGTILVPVEELLMSSARDD